MLSSRYVVKRDGRREEISFDKVTQRIRALCALPGDVLATSVETTSGSHLVATSNQPESGFTPLPAVDYLQIAQEVVARIHGGVTTSELDEFAASVANNMSTEHPEYGTLATRLVVSNFHKNTLHALLVHFRHTQPELTIADIERRLCYWTFRALYENEDSNGGQTPLISPAMYALVAARPDEIEALVNYRADYSYAYRGFSALASKYLTSCSLRRADGSTSRVVIERPQHLLMRVALGIHGTGPYRDYNKARQDDAAIWAASGATWRSWLSPRKGLKLERQVAENRVDWDAWIALLQAKIPCFGGENHPLRKRVVGLRAYLTGITKSWSMLTSEMREGKDFFWLSGEVAETYTALSRQEFTHATPTLFAAGTLKPQMSSCYLMMNPEDSMAGITKFWRWCAEISKWAGGLGSSHHIIRAQNAYIRGTNGTSNGLPPMIKVVNDISVYVDQGGNKRPGSHAIYLELWHGDIRGFLDQKRKQTNERTRARNLHYGMWICDEFMRRLKREEELRAEGHDEALWYLMSADTAPGLSDVYDELLVDHWIDDAEVAARHEASGGGLAFTTLYRQYIREGRYIAKVSATEIWRQILTTIAEEGEPYMTCKDSGNRKSNQKNGGIVHCSNLCTEIFEVTSPDEIAVCNLASICLPEFVREAGTRDKDYIGYQNDDDSFAYETDLRTMLGWPRAKSRKLTFDFARFMKTVKMTARNLNKVIDINFYPLPETKASNMRWRPIGIGVQGLADLFTVLRLPFNSTAAMRLQYYIFEALYFAALEASCELAERDGPYAEFAGSPAARGQLQFDLWQNEQAACGRNALSFPLRLAWDPLRERIKKGGLRNSLLIAPMPTGGTSDISGNSPAFEPLNGLIYKRRNGVTEYTVVNRYLLEDLMELELWTPQMRRRILSDENAGMADIAEIPLQVRALYQTVWDIDPRHLTKMMLCRAVFIDQSQSFTQFIADPTVGTLTDIYWNAWRRGAKTMSYYVRGKPAASATNIMLHDAALDKLALGGLDADERRVMEGLARATSPRDVEGPVCSRDNPDCESCGA